MTKKTDTILEAVVLLRAKGYQVTVFSSRQRMPGALSGLPDLYLMKGGVSYWVEVKLRHANYMRDQMSDAQWTWYHNRRNDFSHFLRYAVVESAKELIDWVDAWGAVEGSIVVQHVQYIPEYHYQRYEAWRRGR